MSVHWCERLSSAIKEVGSGLDLRVGMGTVPLVCMVCTKHSLPQL